VERFITYRETEENDSTVNERDRSLFSRYYRESIDKKSLLEFWRITKERFANLLEYPEYCDIIILLFFPPRPELFDFIDEDYLKRNIYDQALLTLRYLNDVRRQHAEYLRCMQLEERIIDENGEVDSKVYEDTLKDIPNEYITVPLILCAMLLQVESNLTRSFDEWCSSDTDTELGTGTCDVNSSTIADESTPISFVRDKLKLLDSRHELDEYVSINGVPQPTRIKVIPHADILRMISHLTGSIDLTDRVLRVLLNRKIIDIWQNCEIPRFMSEAYSCHLNNIARLLDESVSHEKVVDYLHLLMFEKLIFFNIYKIKAQPLTDVELTEPECTRSTIRRTQSAPDLASRNTLAPLHRSRSDSEIHYGKPTVAFTDCPILFTLTDTREMLLPGYLYKNVYKMKTWNRPSLDKYGDVELFSARVFLQVVYECFQNFHNFMTFYSEPTDSMLLYFNNDIMVGSAYERYYESSIRTPIKFWEFYKYIVGEEDWERRQMYEAELTEKLMKKSIEMEEEEKEQVIIAFEDECFVLPDSLKGRYLREIPERDARKIISEMREEKATRNDKEYDIVECREAMTQECNEAPNNESELPADDTVCGKASMIEKKLGSKINDADTSFLPAKEILSFDCTKQKGTHDLLGYDLGHLRVQAIYHSKTFLLSGDASVRVILEGWLHGNFDLRASVTLKYCTLQLSNGIDRQIDAFRLTTKRGIELSFCLSEEKPGNRYAICVKKKIELLALAQGSVICIK